MAFNAASAEQIKMVMEATGLSDHGMIAAALQGKNNNVDAVADEYWTDSNNFIKKYGWDEGVFSSNREGDMVNNTAPSFIIHPADDSQVIYGSEPTGFYGSVAPSRPPSRANTRSPIGRVVDLTAGEFTGGGPSNRQEEEADLQRAINESLHASGIQSPQPLPGPPPLPQQSGITNAGDGSVFFGPATRPEYDPGEWSMVRLKAQNPDPEPSLRARIPGDPVFLRCRPNNNNNNNNNGVHRIGPILMILHTIPATRNALLRFGREPEYGYGSNQEWWKGVVILPPDQQAARDTGSGGFYGSDSLPPWSDEVHRLIAFLDSTDRSYGTADILCESQYEGTPLFGDREKDFFQNCLSGQAMTDGIQQETSSSFAVSVEVVPILGDGPSTLNVFALFESHFLRETLSLAQNLYSVWDLLFYMHIGTPEEDLDTARMAMITQPSDVITFRFGGDDGFPKHIEIPETFYIDRYMAINRDQMRQLQLEMSTVTLAFQQNKQKEDQLTTYTQKGKAWDRRVMNKAAIQRCNELTAKIKNHASWRDHEEARSRGDDDFYLPEHSGQPKLWPQEAAVVEHYETKIRHLEQQMAEIDRVMKSVILPERESLQALYSHLCTLLTGPSADEKWNATHKYTLRGVTSNANIVFVRKREPVLMQMDEAATPTEQWWKITCDESNNNTITTYETVVREACGINSKPILVYATDEALEQESTPLRDALKTFVKFDNRHFKQELSQAEQQQSSPKRLKKSASLESMATNQASAGDIDDDMRDSAFNDDDVFASGDGFMDTRHGIGQLVDISVTPVPGGSVDEPVKLLTPPPEQELEMIMEPPTIGREADRLARVSLDNSNSPNKSQEMQERASLPLIARPTTAITSNSMSFVDREREAANMGVNGF
ncbi:hypothetical protein B0T26DRAFT_639576 [Lasiosphaeria miniovina]|uniref:Ubiquitin interaction domain-containing protein n=1 Tax=Lasiosphaeria miniovina TaxID=1954250 RepID=A0AA40B5C5_9PEZI|nr:uncharacterized protein B0T26DRAFT_639576 [Lasiosphaeria miniovina]KAK0727903.1 hypothetical protein B0T26DRAFT_639576 [Lasiosphaeria miniovina]